MIPYLKEEALKAKVDEKEQKKLMFSAETRYGIRMTGKYIHGCLQLACCLHVLQ